VTHLSSPLTLAPGDPASAPAVALIEELDGYLAGLYPAESRHGLSVPALLDPSVRFFLATCAGAIVGCGAFKFLAPEVAEIKRMFVLPAHRGCGYGRMILDQLGDAARAAGVSLLRLETGIYQPEAIALYERCGFQRIAPFADYWDDPLCLFYEKVIA